MVSEKYEIVMLIGDNLSDLVRYSINAMALLSMLRLNEVKSQFGYRYIILPNPTYGDWEKPITKGCKSELEKYNARKGKVVGF